MAAFNNLRFLLKAGFVSYFSSEMTEAHKSCSNVFCSEVESTIHHISLFKSRQWKFGLLFSK